MRGLVLVALLACACVPVTRDVQATSAPTPIYVATIPPANAAPATALPAPVASSGAAGRLEMTEYPVGKGQGPHDVAPAADGGVWYTAQRTGELGYLDPKTGTWRMVKLGAGSAPHGVIVGPDGAPWITDSGLNAIVRVDPKTSEVRLFKLPGPNVNLNTATFDFLGDLWFTGQGGYYGRVAVRGDGRVDMFPAPRGAGPYGIAMSNRGSIFYASLAGNHITFVDLKTAEAIPVDPPTPRQGARRVWPDSSGRIWVSEWNAGQVSVFTPSLGAPATGQWKEWKLPGASPMAYAVYVDDHDIVWLTDFGANALVRFDPVSETFTSIPLSGPNAAVRQLLGRPGEVWGAMSGLDKLLVVRTR